MLVKRLIMKRTALAFFYAALLAAFAEASFAATTLVSSPEISMDVPSYLSVIKSDHAGAFPSDAIGNFNTMNILVLGGQFPSVDSMQNSLASLSAVPFASWTLADSADNDARGWTWRREYRAEGPGGSVAYAVIGQGAFGSYIVFFLTGSGDYLANSADFTTWRSTIAVSVPPSTAADAPPPAPF